VAVRPLSDYVCKTRSADWGKDCPGKSAQRPGSVCRDPPQRTNEKYTCTVVDIISTHDTRTIVRMYQQDTASAL